MPIESFVTTLIHWTFFLMTRTKLAFVGFVAAGNSMWHQVLDDAKVSASLSQISPQRHATLPTHQTVPSTTPYYKVLKSATPVLFCTTKYYSSTTLYYKVLLQKLLLQYYKVLLQKVLLQYYKVLVQYYRVPQSTTPVLLSYYKILVQYYSVLQSTSRTYYGGGSFKNRKCTTRDWLLWLTYWQSENYSMDLTNCRTVKLINWLQWLAS